MENFQERLDELARKADNFRKSRDYFKAERDAQKITYDKAITDLKEQIGYLNNWGYNMERLSDRHQVRIHELVDEINEQDAKIRSMKTLAIFSGVFGAICFFLLLLK